MGASAGTDCGSIPVNRQTSSCPVSGAQPPDLEGPLQSASLSPGQPPPLLPAKEPQAGPQIHGPDTGGHAGVTASHGLSPRPPGKPSTRTDLHAAPAAAPAASSRGVTRQGARSPQLPESTALPALPSYHSRPLCWPCARHHAPAHRTHPRPGRRSPGPQATLPSLLATPGTPHARHPPSGLPLRWSWTPAAQAPPGPSVWTSGCPVFIGPHPLPTRRPSGTPEGPLN